MTEPRPDACTLLKNELFLGDEQTDFLFPPKSYMTPKYNYNEIGHIADGCFGKITLMHHKFENKRFVAKK